MCISISTNTIKLPYEAPAKKIIERLYSLNVIPQNKQVKNNFSFEYLFF